MRVRSSGSASLTQWAAVIASWTSSTVIRDAPQWWRLNNLIESWYLNSPSYAGSPPMMRARGSSVVEFVVFWEVV